MTKVPDAIDRYSDVALWGVTPSALLTTSQTLSEPTTGATEWSLLRRHYDLWVLQTNYQPSWDTYRDYMARLAQTWITPPLQQTALFVEPDKYRQFVTGCLYHHGSDGIIRLLNWATQQYDPEQPDNRIRIRRQDVSQYAEQSDIRVLAAVNAVNYTPDGYVFDTEVIRSLTTGLESERSHAAWALLTRLLERIPIESSNTVIRSLLDALEFPVPDNPPSTVAGSLPIYVKSRSLEPLVSKLFGDDLPAVIQDLQVEIDSEIASLERSLRVDFVSDHETEQEVAWPLSDEGAAVCAIASQRSIPVAADWLIEIENFEDIFSLHAQLQDAGLDVVLQDRLLLFNKVYAAPVAPELPLEEYQAWLDQTITKLRKRHRVFGALKNEIKRLAQTHHAELGEQVMQHLDQCEIRPTTFVYSMLDPERLRQYSVEKYVGESDHLEDELRWIREWRENEPLDARPFSSVLPEIISYPLEHESAKPELQIMSPWFNFALQDYAALFTRLLENDVQIKMLFRLPSYNEWNQMQSRFFERIDDTHGNLQLRTYTRYMKYREHNELAEIEDDPDKHLSEFGIHSKMYIAGDEGVIEQFTYQRAG